MMLIGSSQAAASEAAASFPLALGASNTPQEPDAADTFGDLLAATIGETEQASDLSAAASAAQPGPMSVADAWFNALTIDFADLNSALESEEMEAGTSLDAADAEQINDSSEQEDDDAAFMAFGLPVPIAHPIGFAPQAIAAQLAPRASEEQTDTSLAAQSPVRQALLGLPTANSVSANPRGFAPQVIAPQAIAPQVIAPQVIAPQTSESQLAPRASEEERDTSLAAQSPVGQALSGLPTPHSASATPREFALQAIAAQASEAHLTPQAETDTSLATQSPVGQALSGLPDANSVSVNPGGLVPQALAPQTSAPQTPDSQAWSTPATESPVAQALSGLHDSDSVSVNPRGPVPQALAPQAIAAQASGLQVEASLGPDSPVGQALSGLPAANAGEFAEQATASIDHGATALPPTGRTREAIAAKLAEMIDLGQTADASSTIVATQTFAGDAESESQDAASGDASGGAVRQATSGANTSGAGHMAPIFTVHAPGEALAAAAVRETAQLQQAPAGAAPDAENVGRLIQSMRVQLQQGVQEATVKLKPEHFGEVTIALRIERGSVSAVIHTEAPAVQQWLESQEDKLRSGLADQGLHLERFQVQRDRSQERRDQQRQQQSSTSRYRQSRDTGIRFEVTV